VSQVAGATAADVVQKGIDLATAGKPWHLEFQEVSNTLKDLGQKVLIIADDIDRLDSDELLNFLKVVRLLGRSPNVHYLIAYDQATVEQLLKVKSLGTRSAAFMEKIVQYPFEVPPIAGVIQRRLFTDTIETLIQTNNILLDSVGVDRVSELISVLAPTLVTPRAQTRFREQLLSFAGMLSFDELDAVDYVGLSFLRVFYHDVYDKISAWKSALQSGKVPLGFLDSGELSDKDWHERIIPLVDTEDDVVVVKAVLSILFPGIKSPGLLYFREHPKALSNDLYFQRYFILGVAEDDVEDQLVASAIDRIVQGDFEHANVIRYTEIVDGADDQRSALALEKSQSYRSGTDSSPSRELVQFLFERLRKRSDEDEGYASPRRVLLRWLESEVYPALARGQLNGADLLRGLSPEGVLSFIGRTVAHSRMPDQELRSTLGDLDQYFFNILENELESTLDSGSYFRNLIDACYFFRPDGIAVLTVGVGLADSGDAELLERIILAMVYTREWKGAGAITPELAFSRQTLERFFDQPSIRRIAEILPLVQQLNQIDPEDLSPQNMRYFARANVAAVAEELDKNTPTDGLPTGTGSA
jgi:KAP family P-loop domain